MLPGRRSRWALLVVLLVVMAIWPNPLPAQNFSGLQGKELKPTGDLLGMIGNLIGGGKGSISKVVVTGDWERTLVLQISYKKLADREIAGDALGADGKPQPQIQCQPAKLTAADGQVELTLKLADNVPDGTTLDTPVIRLRAGKPGKLVAEVTASYTLGKHWEATPGMGGAGGVSVPQGGTVTVTCDPVGWARDLTNTPPGQQGLAVTPRLQMVKTARVQATPMVRRTGTISKKAIGGATPAPGTPAATVIPLATLPVDKTPAPAFHVFLSEALIPAGNFQYGQQDNRGKGPGQPFDWLTTIAADPPIDPPQSISSIGFIYQDQKPESGLFYFLPRDYCMGWTPDGRYAMGTVYLASPEPGKPGQVVMSVHLATRVDTAQRKLAEELLQAECARRGVPFTALLRFPVDEAPAISLADALKGTVSIPADQIYVAAFSDTLGEIVGTWNTDSVTTRNIETVLSKDIGINGTATFEASGGKLGPQAIPVSITLGDPESFGRPLFTRGQAWRNDTPYPVRLKYVRALMLQDVGGKRTPAIYSWSLGDTMVAPGANVNFDATKIPGWIDKQANVVWIDFAIPGGTAREPYDKKVLADITGGVPSLTATNITIRTLKLLADTGAAAVSLRTRSKYFDPQAQELQELPELILSEDNKEYTVGPIHLTNRKFGESIPGDPLYEYTLTVVMPDGTTYAGTKWVACDLQTVWLGAAQVKTVLGFLPSQETTPDATEPAPAATDATPGTTEATPETTEP
jgi:hypothetical protein